MEKAYALIDHHPNNGKIAIYHTFDERVAYLIFLSKTDWPDRQKQEVFRCPRCKSFIFPKSVVKAKGKEWSHICSIPKKEKAKEVINEVDNARTGVAAGPELA